MADHRIQRARGLEREGTRHAPEGEPEKRRDDPVAGTLRERFDRCARDFARVQILRITSDDACDGHARIGE